MSSGASIRPFIPDDQDMLMKVLRAVWGNDTATCDYYRFGVASPPDAPLFLRTLVAERHTRVVGFGSLWTSRIHPTCLYIDIVVHPHFQAQGIGSLLYAQLLLLRASYVSHPLQTATWSTCEQAVQFLKQRGFYEDKRTYMPSIRLCDVRVSCYQQFDEQSMAAGYHIVSLAELQPTVKRNQKIVALASEVYRATHLSNPPALLSQAEWQAITLGDIIEDGCFIACKGDEYCGISFLHPHEQPNVLEFGWRGVSVIYQFDQRRIIQALLYRELRFAEQYGYSELRAEIDTSDPWAMLLLELLPTKIEKAWITFRTSGQMNT